MGDRKVAYILMLILCSIMVTFQNIELVRASVTFWDAPPDAITEPTTVIIVSPEENRTYATNNVTLTVNVGTQPVYDDKGANSQYIRSVYYKADWLEKAEQIFYHLASYEGKTYLMVTKISITLNLAGIPEGNHNITVYAHDSYDLETPSMVNFTIDSSVKEDNTIYIRADGSVEGTGKIQRDGDVYTLTGDIFGGIKVERNSTVIDGVCYTLQGNWEEGWGVDLATLSPSRHIFNVTVKNLRIINFGAGIRSVNNNTIIGNYIAGCSVGIEIIGGSTNNVIKNNTLANNGNPISIAYSGGNHVITQNSMINGTTIIVWLSPRPSVFMNYWSDYNGTDNDGDGIGDRPYLYIDTDYARYFDGQPLMEPVPVIPENNRITLGFLFLGIALLVLKFVYNKRIGKH